MHYCKLGWEGTEHDAKAVAAAMHGGSPEARRPPAAAAAPAAAAPDLEEPSLSELLEPPGPPG